MESLHLLVRLVNYNRQLACNGICIKQTEDTASVSPVAVLQEKRKIIFYFQLNEFPCNSVYVCGRNSFVSRDGEDACVCFTDGGWGSLQCRSASRKVKCPGRDAKHYDKIIGVLIPNFIAVRCVSLLVLNFLLFAQERNGTNISYYVSEKLYGKEYDRLSCSVNFGRS
jgi:hypothetical protein